MVGGARDFACLGDRPMTDNDLLDTVGPVLACLRAEGGDPTLPPDG